MQKVSVDFIKELNNDNRDYIIECKILLSDNTELYVYNTNLWSDSFKIEDAVSNPGKFDIGAVIANKLTFTLNNIYDEYTEYDFTDAVIRNVRVGLVLPDGTEEYVKKGEYTVDDAMYNGSLITLECLDNMSKLDKSYKESKLVYPATIGTIVRDVCTVCGVALNTFEFPNHTYIVQERPSDEALTFRQVLNWCAQISGCFARCNAEGKLEIKWFQTSILEDNLEGGAFDPGTPKYETGDAADGGKFNPWSQGDSYNGGTFQDFLSTHHFISYTNPEISTDDVVITGVAVKEYSPDADKDEIIPYLTGTEGYVLSIEENRFIPPGRGQEVAAYLGSRLIGLRFRPLSFSCLSDPTVEAGDVGFFTDRKCKTYKFLVTNTVFSSGNYQTVTCDAQTPGRNKATRYSAATQAYVELRKQIRKERTEREKALEELSNRLASSSGLYTTVETAESGGKIFYMHDRPKLADSNIVWKMNAEAWGVSTDGGKTWNGGMTVDGDVIVRILTTIGVNASWIDTGRISVKDKDGNVVFLVDMDTKEVVISGDSVRIGGKSVTKAIEEANTAANKALQEAEKMRALNIQLENDAHVVPTDSDGNNGKYTGCDTTVYVLWGQTDISADIPITVSKSAGVVGTWNADTRKYSVTNMTTDAGYVDFTVKYMEITATKRFSISKNKQGIQGEKGPQGIPGKDGGDGSDGRTSYFHVMYAPVGNPTAAQMSKEPDVFIGTYVDFSELDSGDPLVYNWVKIEGVDGKDGTNGIPGKNGIDGKTSYLHIKYSDDGSTFTGNAGEDPGKWMGQYADFTQADSLVFSDYAWAKVQGPQGVQGPKGADGKQYYTWLKYADTPTSGMSDTPTGKAYIGLAYNKETATESNNYADYTWSLVKGEKGDTGISGPKGADGKTYYTWLKYADNSSGSGMSDSPEGKAYIGLAYNKATEVESNNPADYMWSLIKGDKGDKGEQGIQGPVGPSGKSSYFFVRFSKNANGNPMTTSPNGAVYMGTAITDTNTAPSSYMSYVWAKILGDDGAQGPQGEKGTPGTKGEDGLTPYLHIKYSNDGKTFTANNGETPGAWMGTYVDFTEADSSVFSAYTWKKIEGDKGEPGVAGRTYFINASTAIIKRGQDGRISPTSVTFSAYYRDGDSSERTPYYGRFVVSESIDGETWEARYTSEADETSKGYTPTATATALKCVLYAAGGTQTEMDQQTVSIVVDVSNLTQEIIFDTLTNNGEDQGIYLNDGKVYINMTYARGGTLVLGGLNDTNGLLQVNDESDNEIGRFGSEGIEISKGTLTTVSSTSSASLSGGRLGVSYKGKQVGYIGANRHRLTDDYVGLVFDLESEASYMTWAALSDDATAYIFKFLYAYKDFDQFSAGNLYLGAKMHTKNFDIILGEGGILKSWASASGFRTDNFSVTRISDNATYFRVTASATDVFSDMNMHGHSITNQSDARLKDNITDTGSMLSVIDSIEIKSFDWLTDGRHVGAGVIAQQLRQIIPELVSEDDNGLLGVNYIGLIPYLVKAVQELSTAVMPSKLTRSRRNATSYEYTEEEKMAAVELAKPPIIEDAEPEEMIVRKDM